MISKHTQFPKNYLRAFCEYMACKPSQVEHDGCEFLCIDRSTGNHIAGRWVHTEKEVREANISFDRSDIFVCAKGVRWVIINL